jgi:hypothetical protein
VRALCSLHFEIKKSPLWLDDCSQNAPNRNANSSQHEVDTAPHQPASVWMHARAVRELLSFVVWSSFRTMSREAV